MGNNNSLELTNSVEDVDKKNFWIENEYLNFAYGKQNRGIIIDLQNGEIYKYDIIGNPTFPMKIIKDKIAASKLFKTLENEKLLELQMRTKEYFKKVNGKQSILDRTHRACDMGSYTLQLWTSETNSLTLSIIGDWNSVGDTETQLFVSFIRDMNIFDK